MTLACCHALCCDGDDGLLSRWNHKPKVNSPLYNLPWSWCFVPVTEKRYSQSPSGPWTDQSNGIWVSLQDFWSGASWPWYTYWLQIVCLLNFFTVTIVSVGNLMMAQWTNFCFLGVFLQEFGLFPKSLYCGPPDLRRSFSMHLWMAFNQSSKLHTSINSGLPWLPTCNHSAWEVETNGFLSKPASCTSQVCEHQLQQETPPQ